MEIPIGILPRCSVCNRAWDEIPKRPDPRYEYTRMKGPIRPICHGETDDISNIQAECYQCNFNKNAGKLKRLKFCSQTVLRQFSEHRLNPDSAHSESIHTDALGQ